MNIGIEWWGVVERGMELGSAARWSKIENRFHLRNFDVRRSRVRERYLLDLIADEHGPLRRQIADVAV